MALKQVLLACGVLLTQSLGHADAEILYLSTIEELQQIGNDEDYPLNGSYALAGDIDATGTSLWNDGAGFAPLGVYSYFSQSTSFKGTLDGQGHVIIGLTINRPDQDFVGLFSYVGNGGTVRNLGIRGGTVTGRFRVGALAATSDGGIYENCFVNASVSGASLVGGLIGSKGYGSVSRCYALGAVHGTDRYVGGLVGRNGEGASNSVLLDCYSRTTVTGGYEFVGGLVGINNSILGNSYAAGAVTPDEGAVSIGGLAGENSGVITAAYWDIEVTGQGHSAGGTGRTTNEMTVPHAPNTYAGWNFADVWAEDTEGALNRGYPFLQAAPPAPAHPADVNEDYHLTMAEAVAYLAGWQYGMNPMPYAIRAGYLWQRGEYYAYTMGVPPLCWQRPGQ